MSRAYGQSDYSAGIEQGKRESQAEISRLTAELEFQRNAHSQAQELLKQQGAELAAMTKANEEAEALKERYYLEASARGGALSCAKSQRDEALSQNEKLREALDLTQQYVGDEVLPRVAGWSWFDAMNLKPPAALAELKKRGKNEVLEEAAAKFASHGFPNWKAYTPAEIAAVLRQMKEK